MSVLTSSNNTVARRLSALPKRAASPSLMSPSSACVEQELFEPPLPCFATDMTLGNARVAIATSSHDHADVTLRVDRRDLHGPQQGRLWACCGSRRYVCILRRGWPVSTPVTAGRALNSQSGAENRLILFHSYATSTSHVLLNSDVRGARVCTRSRVSQPECRTP